MTTATKQSKPADANTTFEFPSVEETTQRMRDLNERLIDSSKSAGLVALDAFEKAMHSSGSSSSRSRRPVNSTGCRRQPRRTRSSSQR